MKRLFLHLSICSVLFLSALTEIPAGAVSGTWNQSGSPYHIMGNITVPENEILNIEPGCDVIFQGHYKITVSGAISAFGTEVDSIRFSAQNPDLGWKGFDLFYAEDDTEVISSIFQYCVFENAIGDGGYWDKKGGIFSLKYGNQLILQDCSFRSNEADYGGAVYAKYADLIIDNCTFQNNKANNDAGAVYVGAETTAEISNSIFVGNECTYDGGGVYVVGEAQVQFNNCLFSSNKCFDYLDGSGGGVSVWGSIVEFTDCEFTGNRANGDSGGLELAFEASGVVDNCTFLKNVTGYGGGGINVYRSVMEISNSHLAFNQAETGGGLRIGYESTVTFSETERSSIYLNNTTNSRLGCDISISSSHEVNIILDKFTVLEPDEEYIFSLNEYDFDALSAIVTLTSEDIYVSTEGDVFNSGLSANDPIPSIDMALKMADPGTEIQTIHIAPGTYARSTGEAFPVTIKDNIKLLGSGSEVTILDAESSGRLFLAEQKQNWEIAGISFTNTYQNQFEPFKIESSTGILSDLEISDNVSLGWPSVKIDNITV